MKSFSKILLGHEIFSPVVLCATNYTAQKMKFSIRDLFSKCGQIRSFAVFEKIVKHLTEDSGYVKHLGAALKLN